MKFKITVYKLDSKNKERIVDVQTFDKKIDAEDYLSSIKSEIKPYKINDKKNYHILEAV